MEFLANPNLQDTQNTSLLTAPGDAQLTGAASLEREPCFLETAKAWWVLEGALGNSGMWPSPGSCIVWNVRSYF